MQQQFIFFPQDTAGPSAEQRNAFLDVRNPKGPYYGFIGNSKAINKLQRIDFDALGKYNHVCTELNVAMVGRAGCGKTELVRRHNRARKLPLVEISPRAVKTTHDIFTEVHRVCLEAGLPLVELGREKNYVLPPIDLFIDEVHAITPMIVQGLLKATEYNDGTLVTEKGVTANCRNVHWIIATTDRGKLFDAFDTRFVKVTLTLYGKEEIAHIVQHAHPTWTADVCALVAHYCARVPREALAFAREMQLEYNRNPGDWKGIAKLVAEDNNIDPFGMTYQRLAILKALGMGPVAEKRLPIIAGVKMEELEKFTLPWLLEATEDQQPFITVTHRGYMITEAGLAELDKRSLPHKGDKALAA
jgi:MoxR-like ATPase